MDIASWLRELGLERYERAFQQSEIEPEILAELTDADLKELGIPLGPRRKLAKAIAALSVETAPSGHPTPAVAPATPAPQAERRQLTVLFVDLVGSTALAARLDPEDMGAVMRAYHGACAETVERWGGHVAKYMGDGVLAYFGWPQAHEDDAERAVRAGLELVAAVSTLDATGLAVGGGRAKGQPLAARIGIATGLVMVGELIGEGSAKEQTVIGETPNLAARLQALAAPGSVVIGQATRKLVGALFELVDLGPRRLKGFTTPIAVWQVAGEGRAEGRFEALHGERLTPLVGREHELGILLERWAWARDGDGQVVLLAGEPGIGKSRLTQALYQRLAGESFVRLRYYCSPYYVNSAFYPIIDQLERAAGFRPEDTAETKLDKVETLFAKPSEDSADLVPLIANLLSIPTSSAFPPAKWSPTAQKMKTMELLISQLKSLAQQQAILVVFEDAHWIDPTTSEWIGLVIEHIQHLPVLLLMTFRPEYAPPWTSYPHVTSLTLSRLGQRQGAQMVERLTGNKPLPAEVFEQILLKTDGVPLFVEELTKTVLDSGLLSDAGDHFELSGPLPPLAIPATLHDSLMARLDRLASVKEVAQIGAVIGREFSHELLKAVAPLATRQLHDALTELVASELIFRRGLLPDAVYYFKHALVRDAAYQSLLKTSRQQYHQRIAQVLEDRFPRTAETEPEILAQHYSEAGLADEAIDYWHRAGQLAIQRSANVEAVIHCERALELISQIPETAARHERELQIQMTLGPASVAARGFADPAVGRAYARAWELCQRLEDKVRLPVVLRGRQVFHRIRGELGKARGFAEQLLALAERQQDRALLVGSCHALGQDLFQMGDLTAALRTVEQGVAIFDPEQHRLQNWPGGQPGEQCYLYGAFALWMLGYPDQGLRRGEEALGLAHNLSNPANLINTLAFVALVHLFRRETAAARQRAQATMHMSAEQRNPYFLAWGRVLHGVAQAAEDQGEHDIAEIARGIAEYRATGSGTWLPYFLGLQAETYLRANRPDDGLAALAEAMALSEKTQERCWQAELNRIKGELLLALPSVDHVGAETCFSQSLEIARPQQAKSWELRAATSLARLWAEQSERQQAFDLLAPIYAWFTEGFDTADLKDAKALLDAIR